MARRQLLKRSKKPVAPPAPPPEPPRPDPAGLTVVVYPDPVLKRRGRDVPVVDDYVRGVAARMKQLMEAHEGVGLAAPQVGLSLRLFVFAATGKAADAQALINPRLSQQQGEEGCLSLPDIRGNILRYKSVHLDALDEQGRPVSLDLADYPARIAQHEYDHLDGILITDRMSPVARLSVRRQLRALEAKSGAKSR